jgi:hypothetical protein
MDMDLTQVTSGLNAGDRVATSQLTNLSDGVRVNDQGGQ